MIKIYQTLVFSRAKKKLYSLQIKLLDSEIEKLRINPNLGEAKRGDLAGIFVHKFKMKRDLFLLAYTYDIESRTLIMLGSHENFYRDLKRNQ